MLHRYEDWVLHFLTVAGSAFSLAGKIGKMEDSIRERRRGTVLSSILCATASVPDASTLGCCQCEQQSRFRVFHACAVCTFCTSLCTSHATTPTISCSTPTCTVQRTPHGPALPSVRVHSSGSGPHATGPATAATPGGVLQRGTYVHFLDDITMIPFCFIL